MTAKVQGIRGMEDLLPGASAILKCPVADDCTRVTSAWVGSRRIVIVAWYGLSQTLPGRSTGQVGAILTSPTIPESRGRVRDAAKPNGDPPASTNIDTAARAAAKLHLLDRTLHSASRRARFAMALTRSSPACPSS